MHAKTSSRFVITSIVVGLSLALRGTIVHAQVPTIPTTYVLSSSAADTSKPGFIWRVHQVTSGQPNNNARTEAQLAGLLGDNVADPNAVGVALGPGAPPDPSTAPITFEIKTVINVDQAAGSSGNFQPDDQMPGIPGTTGSTDSIAAEVLTWLDLPAGEIVMGVNSDDGFKVTIGGANPQDQFALKVGEFDGGRGAGDSIFRFTITQAGLYAVRCSWEEGGGDARLEWYTAKADGSRVLINDTANGGIKAYRAATSPSRAFARFVTPPPGTLAAAPNAPIRVELVDGSTAVDPATVKLAVDGADVAATVSKAGNVTTVTYTAAAFYAPNSAHTASLSFTEGTNPVKVDWSFRVANYQTIPRTAKVEPDLSKPGFVWNTFANSANQANNNARTEAALAGQLLAADGTPLPNNADPAAQGVAIAPSSPPDPANATIRFEIETVINVSQSAGDNNGNFRPDEQMPGIPQTDGSTDGIAAEILTYLELPAGVITMGVNSDDGFRTTAGQPYDAFAGLVLGEFNGGRGAADTIFSFVVEEAGVYAFRTIWEEGSGALLLN